MKMFGLLASIDIEGIDLFGAHGSMLLYSTMEDASAGVDDLAELTRFGEVKIIEVEIGQYVMLRDNDRREKKGGVSIVPSIN